MKTLLSRLVIVLAAALAGTAANAQTIAVPASINYQGVLADGLGNKMPDGNTNVVFRLFSTAIGGSTLWGPKTNSVAVVGGSFNTLVGGADRQPVPRDFGAVLAAQSQVPNPAVFLEVSIGGTAVVPRQQVLSAPYAMMAGNAGKLNGFSWADLLNAENPVTGKLDGAKVAPGSIPFSALGGSGVPGALVVASPQDTTRLRVVLGTVNANGSVAQGSGFTVGWDGQKFVINFSTPFSRPPTVVAAPVYAIADPNYLPVVFVDSDAAQARVHTHQIFWNYVPIPFSGSGASAINPGILPLAFSFVAIGPE